MRVVLESGRGIAVYCLAAPASSDVDRGRAHRRPLSQRARRGRFRPGPEAHARTRASRSSRSTGPATGPRIRSTMAGGRRWRRRRTISRRCSTGSAPLGWASSGGRQAVGSRSRSRPGTPTSSTGSQSWRRRRRTRGSLGLAHAARRARAASRRRSRRSSRRARRSARLARARGPRPLREALWLLGAGQADEAALRSRRCVGKARRDAGRRVRPGNAWARGGHRRLLPPPVGLRAVGGPREDAPALRVARPGRRAGTRAVVGGAAAVRAARGRAGRGTPADSFDVVPDPVARRAGPSHLRPVDGARKCDSDVGVEEFSAA